MQKRRAHHGTVPVVHMAQRDKISDGATSLAAAGAVPSRHTLQDPDVSTFIETHL